MARGFVIASGRRHQNSVRFYHNSGSSGLMISCSGALAKDPNGPARTLREVLIPAALADELVARGEAGGFMVIYYHRDGLYVNRRDHWTELYESRVRSERAAFYPGGLRALRGEAALKIVWYGEPGTRCKLARGLRSEYREYGAVSPCVSARTRKIWNFSRPPPTRRKLSRQLPLITGWIKATTLAFGDGENDSPMLRWVHCGVAVDRANGIAKDAARLVGPPGPPEESFARAVGEVFREVGKVGL